MRWLIMSTIIVMHLYSYFFFLLFIWALPSDTALWLVSVSVVGDRAIALYRIALHCTTVVCWLHVDQWLVLWHVWSWLYVVCCDGNGLSVLYGQLSISCPLAQCMRCCCCVAVLLLLCCCSVVCGVVVAIYCCSVVCGVVVVLL